MSRQSHSPLDPSPAPGILKRRNTNSSQIGRHSNLPTPHFEQLAQHPERIPHLSTILPLLELDPKGWEGICHLRNHEANANALRKALPHLYQIPGDMFMLLQDLRADIDFESMKDFYMRTIAAGTTSPSTPSFYRSSTWSQSSRASTLSIASSFSTTSRVSSHTSHNSTYLSPLQETTHPSSTPLDLVQEEKPSGSDVPPAPVAKDEKYKVSLQCHLAGCGKIYKYQKHLENHMMIRHQSLEVAIPPTGPPPSSQMSRQSDRLATRSEPPPEEFQLEIDHPVSEFELSDTTMSNLDCLFPPGQDGKDDDPNFDSNMIDVGYVSVGLQESLSERAARTGYFAVQPQGLGNEERHDYDLNNYNTG